MNTRTLYVLIKDGYIHAITDYRKHMEYYLRQLKQVVIEDKNMLNLDIKVITKKSKIKKYLSLYRDRILVNYYNIVVPQAIEYVLEDDINMREYQFLYSDTRFTIIEDYIGDNKKLDKKLRKLDEEQYNLLSEISFACWKNLIYR